MALTTLTEARQLLSGLVGDLVTSTCQTGGVAGASLIDTALKDEFGNATDACNNQWVIITSGARLGDMRRILSFVAAGTITPYTAFGAQLASGVAYEIHKIWAPPQKRLALNWALRRAYPYIARNIVDDQITTVADTWAYRMGDYGTCTAATSVSLTDSSKAWITNQFAGYRVQAQEYQATVASNTATALTVAAWDPLTTPTSLDAYSIIHPIEHLYGVSYETNEDTATYPYASVPYEVRAHEGTMTVQMGRTLPADRTLRLRGRGYLTDWTTTETSCSEVEENHIDGIILLAAYWLFRMTPALSASQDRDFYREESNRYLRLWEAYRADLATRRFPVKLWTHAMTGRHGGARDLSELAIYDTPAVE